jgi:hypothetical protein
VAKFLKKLKLPKKYINILILLLCTDLFFALLHITHKAARLFDLFSTIRNDVFNIYYDLTLAESFQYIKEYWIIILFIWLIFKKKKFFYTGWALLFTYLLFDDMLGIHGELATFFLERFGISSTHVLFGELRYQDFGELGVSLFFGALFLSLIAVSYLRSGAEVRTIFHYLVGGLLLIVFFGVVNDFVNRVFEEDANQMMFEISRFIEDGGEMLGMSLMCWYVLTLTDPEPALSEA